MTSAYDKRLAQEEAGDSARLRLYVDRACIGNPGPGGWAYVLLGDGGWNWPPPSGDCRLALPLVSHDWRDVLVAPEEVRRIVRVLQRDQARIISAKRCPHPVVLLRP